MASLKNKLDMTFEEIIRYVGKLMGASGDQDVAFKTVIQDPTTNTQFAGVDASGNLKVISGTGSVVQGDVAHDAVDSGNPVKIGGKAASSAPTAVVAADRVNAYFDLNGRLVVLIDTALPAGTNAIGKLAANSGVDIGDVDVLSLPALPAGTNAIGKLVANSGVDIGDVDVLSLPALPAGTNAIGKLAANSGVDIGDVDVLGGGIHVAATATTAASGTADVDAMVAAGAGLRLMGFAMVESAVAPAAAEANIVHGATGAGGTLLMPVTLAADQSTSDWFGPDGIACASGISIDRVSGSTTIVVFTKTVA